MPWQPSHSAVFSLPFAAFPSAATVADAANASTAPVTIALIILMLASSPDRPKTRGIIPEKLAVEPPSTAATMRLPRSMSRRQNAGCGKRQHHDFKRGNRAINPVAVRVIQRQHDGKA